MTNRDILEKLYTAVDHAAPRDSEGLLARTEEKRAPIVFMEEKKRRRPMAAAVLAACLALVILAGAGTVWQENFAVSSVVSLDVNPSIELRVNRREKVLSCSARSDDAIPVLADMNGGADLKGAKLDVAVNALVGALVRNGYLDSLSSTLLITVEDNNARRGERLQQELETSVGDVLTNATVLGMNLSRDNEFDALAESSSISGGKAAYVEQVRSRYEGLSFDSLALLTIEELRYVMESGTGDLPIGKETAAQIALEHAGLTELTDARLDVDLEFSGSAAYYEVEIEHPNIGELEYWIDANTGAVLRGTAEVMEHSAPTVPSEARPAPGNGTISTLFDDDRGDDDDWEEDDPDDDRNDDDDWEEDDPDDDRNDDDDWDEDDPDDDRKDNDDWDDWEEDNDDDWGEWDDDDDDWDDDDD